MDPAPARRGMRVAIAVLGLVLLAACDGGSGDRVGTGPAATAPPASSTPPTTTDIAARPCLRAGEASRVFRFTTGDGATLVGLVLGTGRIGLVLGHQLGGDPDPPAGRRVVSLSGASGFGGVDTEGAMARLEVPVLFVVGADDRPFPSRPG